MRGFLLDTSVALMALREPERLSPSIYAALNSGPTHLSVLSFWEVLIKSMKGKLDVGDPRLWWTRSLTMLVASPLGLSPSHIEGIYSLPQIHKDPYDRALLATAAAEGMTLLTTDQLLEKYASPNLRVLM